MGTYADLILENGNITVPEPGIPGTASVAVRGDSIWLIGNEQEIGQVKGRSTKVIDCRGKTLVPGFNDAHCHLFSYVHKLLSLDLSPAAVRSITDIKEVVRRKAQTIPEGTWISGTDYNEFYLQEKRHPTRQDLDEAAPNHPVVLSHRSLHACVLNSLALRLAGITNESEAPEGGIIERDLNTGEPNGILFEMLGHLREKVIPPVDKAELDRGLAEANRRYLSLGITSIGEATHSNDFERWQFYRQMKKSGIIKSRIYMMWGPASMKQFKEAGLTTGSGDSQLRVGSLKIMLSEATGKLYPSQTELNEVVLEATEAGFQVAIHAIERNSVEAAIIALERAQKQYPIIERRHRIEHCSECPPELSRRLSLLKSVVVSQPSFVYYSGERYLVQVSPETQKWLYAFKSMLDYGVVVAGSSDSPVVPNNPLAGIYAAVTRRAESGQVVSGKEAISAGQALNMYTRNAAYATFEEKIKGSLVPGQKADIVVLSHDPLNTDFTRLKDIAVEMTLIGGDLVYFTN